MKKHIILAACALMLTSTLANGHGTGRVMTKDRAINFLCKAHNTTDAIAFEQAMIEYETLKKHGLDREADALAINLFVNQYHHERRERARTLMEDIETRE